MPRKPLTSTHVNVREQSRVGFRVGSEESRVGYPRTVSRRLTERSAPPPATQSVGVGNSPAPTQASAQCERKPPEGYHGFDLLKAVRPGSPPCPGALAASPATLARPLRHSRRDWVHLWLDPAPSARRPPAIANPPPCTRPPRRQVPCHAHRARRVSPEMRGSVASLA